MKFKVGRPRKEKKATNSDICVFMNGKGEIIDRIPSPFDRQKAYANILEWMVKHEYTAQGFIDMLKKELQIEE